MDSKHKRSLYSDKEWDFLQYWNKHDGENMTTEETQRYIALLRRNIFHDYECEIEEHEK